MPTFLVTSATGHQGFAAARDLLQAGASVFALVRNPEKAKAKELEAMGAVLVKGDMTDVQAIEAATAGVKGIFLNPFPDFGDPTVEAAQVERVLVAAHKAGTVDTVVLSTSNLAATHLDWFAEDTDCPELLRALGQSKHLAEEALRSNKGRWLKHTTILRPPWLTYNFTSPSARVYFPEWWNEGILKTAILTDVPMAQLDAGDVGRVAAKVLLAPEPFAGLELKLAACNVTMREAFRIIGEITSTELSAEWVDPKTLLEEQEDGKAIDVFRSLRAAIGWSCNVKGNVHTEEELEKQKVFEVELTPLRRSLENLQDELFVHFRGGVA